MISCQSMLFDIFLKLDTGNFKNGKRSIKMSNQKFPPMSKSYNNNMRIVKCPGILINLIQLHFISGIIVNIMKDHHKLFDHIVNFCRWFNLSSDQYFNRDRIIEYLVKLVHLLLLILIYQFFVGQLLILDSLGLLSFLSWQFLPLFSLFHFQLVFYQFSFGMHLHTFHFVFDVMCFDLDTLLELGNGLWFVNNSFCFITAFVCVLFLHFMLFLAFFTHC